MGAACRVSLDISTIDWTHSTLSTCRREAWSVQDLDSIPCSGRAYQRGGAQGKLGPSGGRVQGCRGAQLWGFGQAGGEDMQGLQLLLPPAADAVHMLPPVLAHPRLLALLP